VKPYYEDDFVTLYHGDALKLLREMGQQPDTCVVDPVWPNSVFPNVADPQQLFADACELMTCERLVVHLGCSSDPRFLASVPPRWQFLRACWLRHARPSYRGRILASPLSTMRSFAFAKRSKVATRQRCTIRASGIFRDVSDAAYAKANEAAADVRE
jgi:hypothetical protein